MKEKVKKAKSRQTSRQKPEEKPVAKKKGRGDVTRIAAYQFKPGQSGNPSGKPKGKLNFDTRIDLAIEALATQFAEQHNKKNAKRIGSGRAKAMTANDVDIEGDIFRQYINMARNGKEKMLVHFMDRRHGKAMQPVQVGSIPGDPLAEAQIAAAEAEVEAWERQWESMGVKSGNKKHGTHNTDKAAKS